jgi:hypothetical protein
MNGPMLLVIVCVIGLYAASVLLHPSIACGKCEGKSRHYGAVFSRSFRSCSRCGGSGKKRRWGAVLLGVDDREGSMLAGPVRRRRP